MVPVRNAAYWLPPLLAALVGEWHIGFELVAIDDDSSDGSGRLIQKLCSHWPKSRWRLLNGGGRGVSAARNLGVVASRAPLIAFLDADDRPIPGRLSLPLHWLQANANLSHVHGGWYRCDANGRKQHPVRPWQEGAGFSWHNFLEHKAVLPSAWTIRRKDFLAVGGFDQQLQHSEDVDLLLRLAAAGYQGSWIHKELVRYRIHSGNASGQLQPQLQGLLQVMNRHLDQLPDSACQWAREVRYSTITWAVWQAWHGQQHTLALTLLRQALQDCPYPLVRRPVHFLETFQHSHKRIGDSFNREVLIASSFWHQAEALLLRR